MLPIKDVDESVVDDSGEEAQEQGAGADKQEKATASSSPKPPEPPRVQLSSFVEMDDYFHPRHLKNRPMEHVILMENKALRSESSSEDDKGVGKKGAQGAVAATGEEDPAAPQEGEDRKEEDGDVGGAGAQTRLEEVEDTSPGGKVKFFDPAKMRRFRKKTVTQSAFDKHLDADIAELQKAKLPTTISRTTLARKISKERVDSLGGKTMIDFVSFVSQTVVLESSNLTKRRQPSRQLRVFQDGSPTLIGLLTRDANQLLNSPAGPGPLPSGGSPLHQLSPQLSSLLTQFSQNLYIFTRCSRGPGKILKEVLCLVTRDRADHFLVPQKSPSGRSTGSFERREEKHHHNVFWINTMRCRREKISRTRDEK